MASVIGQSFIDIMTLLTNTGAFNYVAIWNDHVNRLTDGSGYSFHCPAAFVEYEAQESYQLTGGLTHIDYIVRIHIVHQELDAADGTLDQNVNVFTYRDATKTSLLGQKPTNFSNLQYYAEFQDYTHNNIYHYILEFIGGFIDTKGSPYDADSTDWIEKEPPTELSLTASYNPPPYLKGS